MSNLSQIFTNLQSRNKNLVAPISDLKNELENCFSKKIQEAGVINPGYFSYFLPILEKYKTARVITKYHISEEQYTDSYTGNLITIPCVDIFTSDDQNSTIRLFILPKHI